MTSTLLNRAQGRWPEILGHFGLEARYLRIGKQGPCPLCKTGVDRYSFSDAYDAGSYLCRQCGPGNGYTLLKKLTGWADPQAMAEIAGFLDAVPAPPAAPEPKTNGSTGNMRANVKRLLAEADAPHLVDDMLAAREVTIVPSTLHGHAHCPFFDKTLPELDRRTFPAVLAPITAPRRGIVSAQRLYLVDEIPPEHRKKTMPCAPGDLKGAAVRLLEPVDGELAVAEGVVTALSAAMLFRMSAWAALSAIGLESFEPPPDLGALLICADNDDSFTGQAAAYALARRLRRERPELAIRVELPLTPGHDFNNVLLAWGKP